MCVQMDIQQQLEMLLLEQLWEETKSGVQESARRPNKLSSFWVKEGKRLLAAVQQLKAETNRMCQQRREEDEED